MLAPGTTVIGRAPSCDIVLNAPGVSRQHARLSLADGRCVLIDAGSRYGTQVNGQPVAAALPLKAGDVIQCGQIALSLEQRLEAGELLSEEHQLLEDSGTLIRQIDPEAPTITAARAADGGASGDRPPERRRGADRRASTRPFFGRDRRSGRERRQSRLLQLLSGISKTLVTVQPLPQVLTRVADLVFDALPAERVFLLLRDSAHEALTARVLRNRDGSAPEQTTLSRTVINHVMRERVAMLAADARYDPRLDASSSIQALNVRSFICAPLWNGNDVIGVLYADNPRSKRFVADDLEVFTALCNYAAVAIEQARTSEQLLQETRHRERLQRSHSPAAVDRILQAGSGIDALLLAQERDVTVMFCDVVSFTAMCEGMAAPDAAHLLNQHLTRMAEEIFELEGTLDTFIGDAILAVFGAPFAQADHADRAVQAAIAMRRALAQMNRSQPRPLQVRIAINSGRALTGDIGSPRRREFTVLGDVVNIASRLESSVAQPGQIVISRATLDCLERPVQTRALGSVSLRGRPEDVEVFEVV